ncbi:MAG TPA: FKBP-type peptidyl-prolyl cis-trans isomerase [Bacteroidia bacterium]|jgi:FKBP-type peptidyl-prolyl cis-trans isomerase|nr:FKBP-type peptidyl-prolyl cis-trans isomerase [Bacteroidia bacterium]
MYKRFIFLLLIFIECCNISPNHSKYRSYTTEDGVNYSKYGDMGTSHKKPHAGDVLELNVNYTKMNDSLFWDSRDIGYPYVLFVSYYDLAQGDSYEKILLNSEEGDSVNFIVPAYPVFANILHTPVPFFLHKDDMIKVNVRINSLLNSEQFTARMKEVKANKEDLDLQEQVDLQKYIKGNHIPLTMKEDNVYLVPMHKGSGSGIKRGDLLSLAYKGYFLSGRMFDSISERNPLQFRYGDTAQVVKGLEIGLKKMQEGEQAKIIIPSQLAFGENGSSTGIVPPFTTVIYEVRLLKVN